MAPGGWVFVVECPLGRVGGDVFPDAAQFVVVPDDVFIIIALP